MFTIPWAPIFVGLLAGAMSTLTMNFLPKLLQKIKYYDTRGILYVHTFPALLGAIISSVAAATLKNEFYGNGDIETKLFSGRQQGLQGGVQF